MFAGNHCDEIAFDAEGSPSRDPFARMRAKKPVFHYLREPHGFSNFQLWGNLHYQMQWSVRTLEAQLAEEGAPHVLQLNAFGCEGSKGDWRNPARWMLYADGREVARGDGDRARRCFEESAETFRDLCREAVKAAGLDKLTEREYWLLCRARDVAKFEPFDRASGAAGAREGRV